MVAIDPSAEFIDDVNDLLENITNKRSIRFKLEKLNIQPYDNTSTNDIKFNILIIFTKRPKKV